LAVEVATGVFVGEKGVAAIGVDVIAGIGFSALSTEPRQAQRRNRIARIITEEGLTKRVAIMASYSTP
jgi:hypothetical protein